MSRASVTITPSKPSRPVTDHRREAVVTHHQEVRPSLDARPKRREFDPLQSVEVEIEHREAMMGIDRGLAFPRKVFDRGRHPGGLDSGHHGGSHFRHQRRFLAKGSDAKGGVPGAAGNVGYRGVIDGDAQRPKLGPDCLSDLFRQTDVAGRPEGHVAGEMSRLGTGGGELAPFLVDGDQHRTSGGLLYVPSQASGLFGVVDVERSIKCHPCHARIRQQLTQALV
jgi:hypothetical protein